MGFPNPGALLVGEDDGDEMVGALEGVDERVDVGGRFVAFCWKSF